MILNQNQTYILQSIFILFFHELGPNILFILNIRITVDRMFLIFRYIIILLNLLLQMVLRKLWCLHIMISRQRLQDNLNTNLLKYIDC